MDILKKNKCKSFFLKCISLLICAIMVFSVFTVSTIAQTGKSDVWDGTKAKSFDEFKGTGTKEDPYQIENASQLAYVVATKDLPKQKYYKLVKDIYINDTSKPNWKSTARNWVWEDFRFEGAEFDGDGHIIDGLYFNGSQKRPGLFSYVGDTVIKNLVITNASVTTTSSEEGSGILAAQASAKATFETIYIDATCELSAPNSKGVAGIVARSNQNVTIKNSAVLATISGKSHVGAFFGTHWGGTQSINNSFSASNVPIMPSRKLVNSANNYALVKNDSYDVGVTVLTANQMKGEAAKTNMSALDYVAIWETVENGYPIINVKEGISPIWDGTKATDYESGSGTKDDPYIIATAEQLAYVVTNKGYTNTPGLYFKLVSDIRINDTSRDNWKDTARNWVWEDARFVGTFDGNGHTIDGLYYTGTKNKFGLFPYVGDSLIKDIKFTNAYISKAGDGVGILAGQASASASFERVYIDETCEINAPNAKGVAGIVAYATWNPISININNCAVLANINASNNTGAFFGYSDGSNETVTINNSFTSSNLKLSPHTLTNSLYNYALVADDYGTTVLTADQMKGEAAKANMLGLDFVAIWETVENGYPIINVKEGMSFAWSGGKAIDYESGSGTKDDPYIIATAEQLAYVVTKDYTTTPGLYFKLANDIRLNDTSRDNWKDTARNWVWKEVRFVGTFDGNGHTIDGLYFNGDQKRMGLFSYIGDSVIKNLVITNASITNTSSEEGTAILAAQASAKATFEAIYIDANCELSAPNCKGVGGIIARSNQNIIIKDSAVLATISGKSHVGSFFGTHWGGAQTVNKSFSTSNVPIMPSRKLVNSANNYALVKNDSYDEGVTVLTADQMKGEAAKTNMPRLDYKYIWKTVDDGYPVFDLREKPPRADNLWDGTKATEFAGGSGLPDDPYLVSNGAQLYKMVVDFTAKYNDGIINPTTYFKITNDIYLNDVKEKDLVDPSVTKWDEAGHIAWCTSDFSSRGTGFCGEVDGGGYTIYGLFCDGGSYAGLIPVAADTTNVYNLNLKNSYICANVKATGAATGGIIGLISGAGINRSTANVTYCKVDNCYFSADNEEIYRVGAVIGGGYNEGKVVISDCGVTNIQMNIINPETVNRTSAFLGYSLYSIHEITNCYSDSTVHPVTDSTDKTLNEDGKTNYDLIHSSRTYTNVYTSSKKADVDIYGDIIYIDESKMKGEAAKKNLKGFDFEKDWVVVENNYPTYRDDPGIWKYDDSLPGEVWSGKVARIYATGNGSKENPFIIETAGQLALLANDSLNGKTNGRYYKIAQDIILNDTSKENWKETANEWFVGSWEQAFKGHLDGDYHTISGLYLNKTKETYNGPKYYGGLFAAISTHAVIEKLGIVNSSMVFTNYLEGSGTFVGAFAGFISYGDFSYEDKDKVTHYVTSEEYPIIRECFADTSVYLEAGTCGGFIGNAQAPIRIEDSFFTGTVKGTGRGLFGYSEMTLYDDVLVKNFYAADSDYAIISNVSYDKFKYENTYSSSAQDTDGVTRLFIDRMIGTAAKTYMTGLDFDNVWVIRGDNETPGLKGFKMDSYSNVMNPKDIKIAFETYCDIQVADMQGKAYSKLKLPVLERDGYKFEGWYAYPELDVPYNYDYFPTFDTILYAKWTLKGFEQGFELYEDSIYDYHEDYEYYLPTMPNYSTDYVHSGGKSMHRIGDSDEELDFLLMYKEELEIGKKYKIVFYTTTDQANAAVDISLVHLDWPDVYSANVGVEKIASVTNLVDGKWVEVSYTFVARSKWIAIRTSGNNSVYFDDFVLFEGGKGEIINLNNPQQTVKPNVDSEKEENGNIEEIVEDEDSFIESKPDNMQVNTKPKSEKNSMLVWYIVIAVAAVLILGGAAFVIIKRVKRK